MKGTQAHWLLGVAAVSGLVLLAMLSFAVTQFGFISRKVDEETQNMYQVNQRVLNSDACIDQMGAPMGSEMSRTCTNAYNIHPSLRLRVTDPHAMLAVKMEAWACSMRHALCILAPLCDSQDTACDNLDSFIATRVKHSSAAGSLEDHQRGLVARVAHRDDLGKRGIHMDADMYLRQRESESWARQLAWPLTIVGAVVLLCAVSSVFSCKAWRRRPRRRRARDREEEEEEHDTLATPTGGGEMVCFHMPAGARPRGGKQITGEGKVVEI